MQDGWVIKLASGDGQRSGGGEEIMKEYENRRYDAEIRANEGEKRIWMSVCLQNIGKEKSDQIICELEKEKERMKKILAGDEPDKDVDQLRTGM